MVKTRQNENSLENTTIPYILLTFAVLMIFCPTAFQYLRNRFLSAAPLAPPSNIRLDMLNSTALHASWEAVPFIHQNGIILGYRIQLEQEEGGPMVLNATIGSDVYSFNFTDLLVFQNYSLQVIARICCCCCCCVCACFFFHFGGYRIDHSILLERFSVECRKIKTKATTLTKRNTGCPFNEPIRIRSKYMQLAPSAEKRMRSGHTWF